MRSTIRGASNRRFQAGSPREDRRQKIETRKARFETLNKFVTQHGGWVTSVPGGIDITIECTETSDLPEKLGDLGYELREVGRRERMAPNAVVEEFISNSRGEMEPITTPSTRPISRRVAHAGLIRVVIYDFEL
jgi:hypothetical protein